MACVPPDARAVDCGLCHSKRKRVLEGSVHGAAGLECTDCHGEALEHVRSLGEQPAPHPRKMPAEQSRALCTQCHDPEAGAFKKVHDEDARRATCVSCHVFHDLGGGVAARGPVRSHGLPVGEITVAGGRPAVEEHGAIEAGYLGVAGNSRMYRSQVAPVPGARLLNGWYERRTTDPDASIDHILAGVRGVNDPYTEGSLEFGKSGSWKIKASGERYEDLFDPTTPLHDLFSKRLGAHAELQLQLSDALRLVAGYDWYQRKVDWNMTRYREISNELFSPTRAEQREIAHVGRIRLDWDLDEWTLHFKQSVRWWRDKDDRTLFRANMLLDDVEDFEEHSRAFTTSTSVSAEGSLLDDRLLLDGEILFAWSRRSLHVGADAQGVTATTDPYVDDLSGDGKAFGRFWRVETGAAYEFTESLTGEVRLRLQVDDDDARSNLLSLLQVPPASAPVMIPIEASQEIQHRTLDVEGLLRWRPARWVDLALGYSGRFEDLDRKGPVSEDASPVDHGLLLDASLRPADGLLVRVSARAFAVDDPYVELSPDRRSLLEAEVRWEVLDDLEVRAAGSRSRTRLSADGSHARLDTFTLGATLGTEEDLLSGLAGWTWTRYKTDVDSMAILGGFPSAFETRFDGHSSTWSAHLLVHPVDACRMRCGIDLADTFGDNNSRFLRLYGSIEYRVLEDLIWRGSITWYKFNGTESDRDDFRSTVFLTSLEWRF